MTVAFVLEHIWQSTLFLAVAALLVRALPHAPARERHAIWLCASMKFLVPLPLLTAAGAALGGHVLTRAMPGLAAVAAWLDRPVRWSIDVLAQPAWTTATPATTPASVLTAVAVLWAAGIVLVAVARTRARRAVWRLARAGRPLASGPEADALRRVLAGRRIGPPPVLIETASDLEPGVLGIGRSRILWPAGLTSRLSATELEAVLAHEVGHVVRRDNLLALAHAGVQALFWFHPLVWWLGARLTGERERACDEEVLRMGIDNRSYAGAIVKVCGFCLRAPAAAMAGVGSSPLAARLERILDPSPTPAHSRLSRFVVPSLVVISLLAPVGFGVILGARTPLGPGQGARAEGTTLPKVVHQVKPDYTEAAKKARIQGSVFLAAVVTDSGRVGEVRVTRSLDTEHGLDEQAVAAMKQWRFEPGTRDGKPVAVEVEVEMTFRLK